MGKATDTVINNDINDINVSMIIKNKLNSMNNDINDNNSAKRITAGLAEYKAKMLVERYNAPGSLKFFLRCVYHLPESVIEDAVEMSLQPWVKCPIKYFVRVCSSKMNG